MTSFQSLFLLSWLIGSVFGFQSLLPHSKKISCGQSTSTTKLSEIQGDPLRDATGIRPSLHPTTINAISNALKARAMKKEGAHFQASDTVEPLEVAVTAGLFASEAVALRQKSSEGDGMTLAPEEEQTIAGRVVGVVMRFDTLESLLHEKVSNVGWIAKYDEWATFGTLKDESEEGAVDNRIKDDPLFCVSRAECLLALFLDTVEAPTMAKVGQTVPDQSKIDFLDADRIEVLVSSDN
ncbi:unnamed protein product [Cylindrotheca closterium]|uniref:Uncharacterized protein n=1 Tax=Cylindrotheca closterium TaxID=2856 RepID=A0AAD2PWD3_9STRA|nr:unnamed protein product [Cylindrotheca closterium]